jgi:hypothetical protein
METRNRQNTTVRIVVYSRLTHVTYGSHLSDEANELGGRLIIDKSFSGLGELVPDTTASWSCVLLLHLGEGMKSGCPPGGGGAPCASTELSDIRPFKQHTDYSRRLTSQSPR